MAICACVNKYLKIRHNLSHNKLIEITHETYFLKKFILKQFVKVKKKIKFKGVNGEDTC